MASKDSEKHVVMSVFDRLLDDEPDLKSEAARPVRPFLRELRNAVRRDLEDLLNTRARCVPLDAAFEQLQRSVANYGIPDLTGANLASAAVRERFLRQLEAIIRRTEPRFKTIRILAGSEDDPIDRTLRFRIEAQLWAEPAPEQVTFDSRLEPVRRTFEIKSGP